MQVYLSRFPFPILFIVPLSSTRSRSHLPRTLIRAREVVFMAWISLIPLALISLWGLSLWRLLCSSSSSRSVFLSNGKLTNCAFDRIWYRLTLEFLASSQPSVVHRAGSGKRRNVLLVVAHPDDESM